VPEKLPLPERKGLIPGIVAPDEFDRKKDEPVLPLVWQWNHNPDNQRWSLDARKGFLRLTTGRVDTSVWYAKNTLTQRTFRPVCSGSTSMDISNMKDGDVAGLVLLQRNYGLVGVRIHGNEKSIIMMNATDNSPVVAEHIPLKQKVIHLRADADFTDNKDVAEFYYSLDGKNWTKIGTQLKMAYTLPQHFMGYRFGLFNYATKTTGGFVDFDYFRIK